MKVVLASKSDCAGGAARAAFRLHTALLGEGVDSYMVVDHRGSDDERVLLSAEGMSGLRVKISSRLEGGVMRLQKTSNPVLHSLAAAPGPGAGSLERLRGDVVHLHWINGGFLSVAQVTRLRGPVVWTLHDMWPFCGAEHYAEDGSAARWRVGYRRENRSPGERGLDLDRWTWQRKRRGWRRPVELVVPTRWLAACVADSALMSTWPVRVIANAVPVETFAPQPERDARQRLGLPVDRPLVLFGAMDALSDVRKGFDLLMSALHRLSDRFPAAEAVVFGSPEPANAPTLPLAVHWMGTLRDDASLSQIYNAVDVMVVPSRQDNLPQTGTEAQACGTPVVAFETAGLPDVVEDRITGYLATPLDAADLAAGITWVIEDPARRQRLADEARRRAVRLWSPRVVAQRYLDVYQDAIDAEQSRTRRL